MRPKIASVLLFALICLVSNGWSLPTLYELNELGSSAERVLVAESSTVIPLDSLPEFTLGFGLGKEKEKKVIPENLKDIQLITAQNQHRFVLPAGVKELTKEEFEQFNLS